MSTSVAAHRRLFSALTVMAGLSLPAAQSLASIEKTKASLIGAQPPGAELNVVFTWDSFTLTAAFLAVGIVSYLLFSKQRLRRLQR